MASQLSVTDFGASPDQVKPMVTGPPSGTGTASSPSPRVQKNGADEPPSAPKVSFSHSTSCRISRSLTVTDEIRTPSARESCAPGVKVVVDSRSRRKRGRNTTFPVTAPSFSVIALGLPVTALGCSPPDRSAANGANRFANQSGSGTASLLSRTA